MANNDPRVSFTFPYRWLNEDRAFLAENLRMMIVRDIGKDSVDQLDTVLAYRVLIRYENSKPLTIAFSKPQSQSILKPLFPNARCLSVDAEYEQARDRHSLPLLQFQLYF